MRDDKAILVYNLVQTRSFSRIDLHWNLGEFVKEGEKFFWKTAQEWKYKEWKLIKRHSRGKNDFKFNHSAIIQRNFEISMLQYILGIHRRW
jgi:hypothetical protein